MGQGIKQSSGWRIAGISSLTFIALLLVITVCPMTTINVGAAEEDDQTTTETDGAQVTVKVKPTVSIALEDGVNIVMSPTADGQFNQGLMTLAVATNNSSGYSILVNGIDGTSLKRMDGEEEIPSITDTNGVTGEQMPVNSWGVYLGQTFAEDTAIYKPLSETATQMIYTEETSSRDNYQLSFGVNVDTSQQAGTYRRSVLVSVVANPMVVDADLTNITYMQEITPWVCENTTDGATSFLADQRDNAQYRVGKLKDGNCWMIQDLALNFPRNLTSADSDVTTTYRLESGAQQVNGAYYYTHSAATAGTAPASGTAPSSICPKGWKLATSEEWKAAFQAYGMLAADSGYATTGEPFYAPLAGYIQGSGTVNNKNGGSYYRTSTFAGSYFNELAVFGTIKANFETPQVTNYLYSVRCVARQIT